MSEQRTHSVSVVGLGMLGSAMATAFLAAGHRTTVWNRSPARAEALVAKGATQAATIGDAISSSPVVVLGVSDYGTIRDLLEPVEDALRGRVLVNLSSGTPETARELADWASRRHATYLDGAAMSGTRLIGRPEALFVFGGSSEAFAAHAPVLSSLGNARYLGEDPGKASLYDTALLGVIWGALAGYFQGVALVGAEKIDATEFAGVAVDHFGFITGLMTRYARQIEAGEYPADEGTLDIHAGALEHLIAASKVAGVSTEIPTLFKSMVDRGIAAGRGGEGVGSIAEVIAAPAG